MGLKEAGYKIENDSQTLKEIANKNEVTPQKLYLAMSQASSNSSQLAGQLQTLPETPAPGTGNLSLADLCSQYNLNIKAVIRSLGKANITSKADMTIKKIGETNAISPMDVYEHIKSSIKE
jgi:hypothetical protein